MINELCWAVVRLNLFGALAIGGVLVLRPAALALFGAQIRYGLWAAIPLIALASLWPVATRTVVVHAPAVFAASGAQNLAASSLAPVAATVTPTALSLPGILVLVWL